MEKSIEVLETPWDEGAVALTYGFMESFAARWISRFRDGALAGLLLISGAPALADFDDAVRAATRGEYSRAEVEFRRLADAGDARGQNGLGVLYLRGTGVEQDIARAVRWFRLAARHGYPAAQTNLGLLYENGWGVPQDDAQAYRWYLRAAHQGDVEARTSVALLLAKGRGTAQDLRAAFKWFERAAHQGHVEAWAHIGHMYRAGEGVTRDYVSSYAWYGIAAAGGYQGAVELRDSVGGFLTQTELERARAMARSLYALHGSAVTTARSPVPGPRIP